MVCARAMELAQVANCWKSLHLGHGVCSGHGVGAGCELLEVVASRTWCVLGPWSWRRLRTVGSRCISDMVCARAMELAQVANCWKSLHLGHGVCSGHGVG